MSKELKKKPSIFRYTFQEARNSTYIGRRADGSTQVVSVIFIRMYRPNLLLFSELCQWGDLIMFGWDLHFKDDVYDREWARDIGGVLNITRHCLSQRSSAKKPMFVWRETATQHFPHIGGYWSDIYSLRRDVNYSAILSKYRESIAARLNDARLLHNDSLWNIFYTPRVHGRYNKHCLPLNYYRNDVFEKYLWRQRLVQYVNRTLNNFFQLEFVYPNKANYTVMHRKDDAVYFIPFKEVTDELWAYHRGTECTHYCTTPYLWQLIWDSLYRIIEKNSQPD